MIKDQELRDANSCLNRSQDDEPVFVLVARDRLAPDSVRDWAQRAELMGVPRAKIEDAYALADDMETWQRENSDLVKLPD